MQSRTDSKERAVQTPVGYDPSANHLRNYRLITRPFCYQFTALRTKNKLQYQVHGHLSNLRGQIRTTRSGELDNVMEKQDTLRKTYFTAGSTLSRTQSSYSPRRAQFTRYTSTDGLFDRGEVQGSYVQLHITPLHTNDNGRGRCDAVVERLEHVLNHGISRNFMELLEHITRS